MVNLTRQLWTFSDCGLDKFPVFCDNMCITLVLSEGFAHMVGSPNFQRLFEIAENQAGYFTASQARQAGFSWERLSYYTTTGKFLRVHHGIYRLAQYPGSPYEDLFVAWLRAGRKAVISHESALYLYNLSDVLPTEVHLTIPRTGSRRRAGLRLHTHHLTPAEVTRREGLPVTSPARTIIDVFTSGLAREFVRQAIHQALQRGLILPEEIRSIASGRGKSVQKFIADTLQSETQ